MSDNEEQKISPQDDQSPPQDVQSPPQDDQSPPQDTAKFCSVCYTDLNLNNIVNTQCSHQFCWECFFKWIKINPTCPLCRENYVSEDVWYRNRDINEDIDNLRYIANTFQLDVVFRARELEEIKLRKKYIKKSIKILRNERTALLKSQISLKQQIEYTDGYLSAMRGNLSEPSINYCNVRNTNWFNGFTRGIMEVEKKYNSIIDYEKLNNYIKDVRNINKGNNTRQIITSTKTNESKISNSSESESDHEQQEEVVCIGEIFNHVVSSESKQNFEDLNTTSDEEEIYETTTTEQVSI